MAWLFNTTFVERNFFGAKSERDNKHDFVEEAQTKGWNRMLIFKENRLFACFCFLNWCIYNQAVLQDF